MKNRSKQQKSRYLQNLVKDRIIKLFPSLTKKDIRTSTTGENGADVKLLTLQARKLFPYSIECKNRSDNKQIYSCLLYTSPSPRDRQKSRMPSSA